ncbi:LiaF transmembrane domain-containing protein [Pseudopedobacter beijingensis]|uniref:LiaF transmembrane domain-containing protein n=1 Tax=Pseudopedobacter beijingensis TaxID=1207056 RepID=A0ABW4IAZ9_9SPHI
MEKMQKQYSNRSGKVAFGLVISAAGVVLLMEQIGYFVADWVLSWPMGLIMLGLITGVKHGFKHGAWFLLTLIGGVFLVNKIDPALSIGQYVLPVALILMGVWVIFSKRPKCNPRKERWKKKFREFKEGQDEFYYQKKNSGEDVIESVSVFGSIRKHVISKTFKGGEVVCIMGGAEINLGQADIQGRVELEVVQVFGGTKLYVPEHWEIITEMSAIFGGVEDKRIYRNRADMDTDKMLVIKGISIFGGIEIISIS